MEKRKRKKHADEMTARPSLSADDYQLCINHDFVKLQEYCTKIYDSRLHIAAVILTSIGSSHTLGRLGLIRQEVAMLLPMRGGRFEPETKPEDPGSRYLLIMGGHGS
jgi:hypothetical protein